MDNLTHSLVGLASAKAGLDRLSPYATAVCVVSANIADADFVTLFFGDRWTLLQHHRGLTHSIVGTISIGLLVPLIAFAIERVVVRLRRQSARIRFRGLLLASMIAAVTHPLLDWTNNYGVRPLLPWNGRWFYGDLVFIFDPYIWLALGGVVFLLTSRTRLQMLLWAALGLVLATFIGLAGWRSGPDGAALRIAFVVWMIAIAGLMGLRAFGVQRKAGRAIAAAALVLLAGYWGGLVWAHHSALANTLSVANQAQLMGGERVVQIAAMPTVATPFQWQSVVETDVAIYRFKVPIGSDSSGVSEISAFNRYPKPTGQSAQLVSLAERDRRVQALLSFARFPLGRVEADNCVGQALVQFADLRYTEPGAPRGNFSVNVPVDCPAR
ncbi:MAG TPA: metal-dependent hydrolase [Pyrinomonadaceae bacterium]|nr:metal-dependent hydrolase [Pyrinomonadaceae bacterium]